MGYSRVKMDPIPIKPHIRLLINILSKGVIEYKTLFGL